MPLHSSSVRCAVRYIEDHLSDERLPAASVVQHVANGCSRFRSRFKRETGCTIGQWIETARLDHARDMLRTSDQFVGEIGFGVGYASHDSFLRAFKRVEGVNPSVYRARYRQKDGAKSCSKLA